MMAWTAFTPRNLEILALARSGLSNPEIARRFGMTRQRVDQIKTRLLGLEPGDRDRTHSPEFVVKALRLWTGNSLSAAQIGKRLGTTRHVIIGVARRNGFPAKPSPIRRRPAEPPR